MINPDSLTGDLAVMFDYVCLRRWKPEAAKANEFYKAQRSEFVKGCERRGHRFLYKKIEFERMAQ